MTAAIHALSVIVLRDGRYRALCVCGFKGIRAERAVAEHQAQQHLSYVAEVAEMTKPPEAGS